jgi:hypothetical protein
MQQTRFHKFTSLFIKLAIIGISIWYIYKQVAVKGGKEYFAEAFDGILAVQHIPLIAVVFLLMALNWSFEALKWKLLINEEEHISFSASLQAVLSGITISIFAPNRTGEFAGRVFYLKEADRIEATLLAFTGSAIQLLITILAAMISFAVFIGSGMSSDFFLQINLVWYLVCSCIIIICFILLLRFYEKKRQNTFLRKIKSLSWKILSSVFFLSLLRYLIFSIQYYLLLDLFNCNIPPFYAFIFIPLTFFVISAVPTFALTEIGVRGAAALYFLGMVSMNETGILSSSFLLWLINIAFPALIGIIFIFRLRFFREN